MVSTGVWVAGRPGQVVRACGGRAGDSGTVSGAPPASQSKALPYIVCQPQHSRQGGAAGAQRVHGECAGRARNTSGVARGLGGWACSEGSRGREGDGWVTGDQVTQAPGLPGWEGVK